MTPSPTNPAPLEVYLLGLVDFDEVQSLQRRLVYELGERDGGALILCEHLPTISVGRNGSRAHIRADDDELKAREIPIRWINRGGGVVLHLPGQLAGYLALPLRAENSLNLQGYIDRLHRAIIAVLGEFDLKGSIRPDWPGIFLGDSRVATVGVAVNRWIAYHGLTLNVGPYLGAFHLLDEPGPEGFLRQTSMESRRQRPAPMSKVREALVRQIEAHFGLEQHHIYTAHPMIRRKSRPHVYAQSLR